MIGLGPIGGLTRSPQSMPNCPRFLGKITCRATFKPRRCETVLNLHEPHLQITNAAIGFRQSHLEASEMWSNQTFTTRIQTA